MGKKQTFSGFNKIKPCLLPPPSPRENVATDTVEDRRERKPRMRAAVQEFSAAYLYRRAFSELTLLDLLEDGECVLTDGTVLNVLTGGNIDQMTYLKLMLRKSHWLDHCIVSTWCMSADDALQLIDWMVSGVIHRLDLYVGEIFKGSYGAVWNQLHDYYAENPGKGRICIFRNHSKIIAGTDDLDFNFYVQTSANMDTNPRTEQACIQMGRSGYEFVRAYFDGIVSFEREDVYGR